MRLEGEEGESDDPRAFVNQPLRTRLVILLAGVAMNFLLAFVIFTGIAVARRPGRDVRIGCVQAGLAGRSRPASWAASRPARRQRQGSSPSTTTSGDAILAIDGQRSCVRHVGSRLPRSTT